MAVSDSPLRTCWEVIKAYPIPLFFFVITIHLLRNKFGSGLSHIPGPALAGYSHLWRVNDVRKGQAHKTMIDLHQKYGKLVRIAPNVVDVSDPATISVIYNLKGDFTKTGFYPIQSIVYQKKPQMNLFSTRDEGYHRELKKKVGNAYSMTSLLEMEPAVDSCSELFVKKLAPYATTGKPFDLGAWLHYYAFDVVGEIAFRKKIGFLETGADVDGMIAGNEGFLLYASICGQVPKAHSFLLGNPILPYLVPVEKLNAVLNFTLKALNSRSSLKRDGQSGAKKGEFGGDVLSRWAAVQNADSMKMSSNELIVNVSTVLFAGSDSTATTLRAIIYFLCKNPFAMKKVVDELDTAERDGLLSNPVAYKEAHNHLNYLNAVIKEALRLHPPVGLPLERYVPAGGVTICGQYIPANTIVGVNAWALHYDEKVFPEPEKFIPGRWLDNDEKKLIEMEKSFFAFGAGSRACMGKNISMMEMNKLIPQLLREYEVRLADLSKEWETRNFWFVQQSGVDCILTRR